MMESPPSARTSPDSGRRERLPGPVGASVEGAAAGAVVAAWPDGALTPEAVLDGTAGAAGGTAVGGMAAGAGAAAWLCSGGLVAPGCSPICIGGGAVPAPAATTNVPIIVVGWTSQWKWYVPAGRAPTE
jgi:hypothetical protein